MEKMTCAQYKTLRGLDSFLPAGKFEQVELADNQMERIELLISRATSNSIIRIISTYNILQ